MNTQLDSKPRILIVDDEKINLKVLGDVLKDDYSITIANGGKEAIEIFSNMERPDMILLDVLMLDMTGFEVCSELKDEHGAGDIPVIFVTSLDDKINEATGYNLGAVDFFSKPINPNKVRERIKHHFTHLKYKKYINALYESRMDGASQREVLGNLYKDIELGVLP